MPELTQRNFRILAGLVLLLALVLRVWGAQGELWLDEIWTLDLLQRVSRPDEVFWKISHTNNHYLNTLYQYALGPNAPVPLRRAMSIAFGMGTVILAGVWARRNGRMQALAAMLLFAVTFLLVQYDSDGRGYAGLVFCSLCVIILAESRMTQRAHRWAFAAATLFGLLSHLFMVFTLVVMGCWVLWTGLVRYRSVVNATRFTVETLWPAMVSTLCFFACFLTIWQRHPIDLGPTEPTTLGRFIYSCAALFQTIGTVPNTPLGFGVFAAFVFCASSFLVRPVYRRAATGPAKPSFQPARLPLYVIGVIVPPLCLVFYSGVVYPRYLLTSGIVYLLCLADLTGCTIARPDRLRWAGLCLLVLLVTNNCLMVARFLGTGRGQYAAAIAVMSGGKDFRYGDSHTNMNTLLVDYYARLAGVTATAVPSNDPDWCANPPPWYLAHVRGEAAPAQVLAGPPECLTMYELVVDYPVFGFSGVSWRVYRRPNAG